MDKDVNNQPFVTVLMPVYNADPYIREAIDSVLTQSYTNFELLIINDGSTDNSLQIIKSYNDARIRLVENEGNLGLIETLNKGLNLAQGEYIARMDADDISMPTRLEKQVEFLDQHQEVAVLATTLVLINEDGKDQGYWLDDYNCKTIEQIKHTLPKINCIGHPTVMMKSSVAKLAGYNEHFLYNEDWGLWLTLLSDGHVIAKLDSPLLYYRIHSKRITSQSNLSGIGRKIRKFKRAFLSERIKSWRIGKLEIKVLISLITDILKIPITWINPRFLRGLKKILTINPVKVIIAYVRLTIHLKRNKNTSSLFFFFPHYHAGGAEKVHSEIIACVADKKPHVFFTKFSEGNRFLKSFKENARTYDIPCLTTYPYIKNIVLKRIAKYINSHNNAITFGSNSSFYYNMIPLFNDHVICIDLVHAFVSKMENPAEHSSIPHVDRLKNRIFISKKAIQELKIQYIENNIDLRLLDRIVYIPNCVNVPAIIDRKNRSAILKILFVGRHSYEKRAHIFGEIARKCKLQNLSTDFTMIGNFKTEFKNIYTSYCTFINEISESEQLNELYKQNDVLLLTSRREGFPMVIMEAMAYGVVPVSTNAGDIPEHIKHNQNGIIINTDDEEKIIEEMIRAIKIFLEDKSKLELLSMNAHRYANDNFNCGKFCSSYRVLLTI